MNNKKQELKFMKQRQREVGAPFLASSIRQLESDVKRDKNVALDKLNYDERHQEMGIYPNG